MIPRIIYSLGAPPSFVEKGAGGLGVPRKPDYFFHCGVKLMVSTQQIALPEIDSV